MSEEAPDATPEDSSPQTEETPQTQEPTGEEKQVAQKRINELTYARREAERDAQAAKDRVTELENQLSTREVDKVANKATDTGQAPNPLDFDDTADFVKAQRQFTTQVANEVADEREKTAATKRSQEQFESDRNDYRSKVQAHAAKDAKYGEDIASADLRMTESMAQVLFRSDKAVELTGYLANHPDEATKLSQMAPLETAREMGRIEAGLESLTPKTVSDAPDSMKDIAGAGEDKGDDPTPKDSDDTETWLRKRRAQLKAKKG